MELTNKAMYIKGLADGLGLDAASKEGKVIAALLELVNEMAGTIEEMQSKMRDLEDYVEELDEDLGDVEEVLVGDDKNGVISHSYKDQLDSLEKLEILHNPVVTRDYDEEKKRVSDAQALLGDAMPVKLCPQNMYYYAPWDRVCPA